MRCTWLAPNVVVCGGRGRSPTCSTPGCKRRGTLECDCPVEREPTLPRPGDARLHRERKVLFYVWRLVQVAGVDHVVISTKPPGDSCGVRQTVTVDDWHRKSSATCDRPICTRCRVQVGPLDYCPAHARAKEATL